MPRVGLAREWQTTGFLRVAGLRKRRKFCTQPPGVRRMRRTGIQGWIPWACAEHGEHSAMDSKRRLAGRPKRDFEYYPSSRYRTNRISPMASRTACATNSGHRRPVHAYHHASMSPTGRTLRTPTQYVAENGIPKHAQQNNRDFPLPGNALDELAH